MLITLKIDAWTHNVKSTARMTETIKNDTDI